MEMQGILIQDKDNGYLKIKLSDLLEEISQGSSFYWSILFIDGEICSDSDDVSEKIIDPINDSKDGKKISWKELNKLSGKFAQIFDIVVIGSQDQKLLKRYESQKQMCQKCEIVLELLDCSFWQVYSKDKKLISKLMKKFKDTESIDLSKMSDTFWWY